MTSIVDQRPVLIIDGQNCYLRAYCAFPTMNAQGESFGGCIGFLKTLQKLCREFQPSRVFIAWEGGGSQRRRKLYPDYKLNRKPGKLNRFYEDDIPDTEENKQRQLIVLLSILKNIPVCQLYVSNVEGDDIVAYLCRGPLREQTKIIVSSDKDMYQLLDESTKVYSLYRKKFITDDDLFEEYRLRSRNFALAKALCGDPTDNVPGIKGLGFKNVTKRFAMLCSDNSILLQDLLDYASSHADESVIFRRVADQVDDIRRNWQLVHLDGSMLSNDQMKKIDHVMNTFKPTINKMALTKLLVKEGICDFDAEGFFYDLLCIDGLSTK